MYIFTSVYGLFPQSFSPTFYLKDLLNMYVILTL